MGRALGCNFEFSDLRFEISIEIEFMDEEEKDTWQSKS